MHPQRDFNLITTNELSVTKTSFLKFIYELTDGEYTYAQLSDPDKFIGTLNNKWTFEKDSSWHGKFIRILVKDGSDKSIGFFTFDGDTRNLVFEMYNGFKAELVKHVILWGLSRITFGETKIWAI